MTRWFVADLRRMEETTGDVIRDRLAAQTLTPGALVWRDGFAGWEPVLAHFGPGATPSTSVPSSAADPPPLPFSRPRLPAFVLGYPRTPPDGRQMFGRSLAAAALWIGYLSFLRDYPSLGFPSAVILHVASVLACCAATAWALHGRSWSAACRFASGALGHAVLLRLGGFYSGSTAAALALLLLSLTGDISSLSVMSGRVSIRLEESLRYIRIEGPIAPGVPARIARLLDERPDTRAIVITSEGGLVEEAIRAAELIERRPDFTVIARKECASACLRILLSGARRYAEWGMELGFHEPQWIGLLSLLPNGDNSSLRVRQEDWFRAKGVPEAILASARGKRGAEMHWVSAIKLAEDGVLTGLADGNRAISVAQALDRLREEAIREDPALEPLLDAAFDLRRAAPEIFSVHADVLYRALLNGDPPEVRAASVHIAREIAIAALAAADDAIVNRYLRFRIANLRQLAEGGGSSVCREDPGGAYSGWSSRSLAAITAAQISLMTPIIRDAAAADWTERPLPEWADSEGRKMLAAGTLATPQGGAADHCRAALDLFARFEERGEAEAAALFRWSLRHAVPAH